MKNEPLVSIIVITYNSSKYVLETLESAKNQSYKNIELIISDDASTDNTCAIVQKFIHDNENYFTQCKLIRAEKNTGISGNCNRGVKGSTGAFIKLIAGDDLLTENCVEDFVFFFNERTEAKIAASQTRIFFDNDINNYQIWPSKGQFPTGLERQRLEILKANFVYNVSIFFTRDLFNDVGGFDENYPMIEDYPFDFKVLQAGYEFFLVENVCVNYRVNYDSTTRPANQNKFVNEISHTNGNDFIKREILPSLRERKMYLWLLLRWGKIEIINKIIKNGNVISSRNNMVNKKILFVIKYLSSKLRAYESKILQE